MSLTEYWEQLVREPGPAVCECCAVNVHAARYCHASWLTGFMPDTGKLQQLLRNDTLSRSLSKLLPGASSADDGWCTWQLDTPRRRLLLLEPEGAWQLLVFSGAVLWSRDIARELLGSRLKPLHDRHGATLHEFALKRAPLMPARKHLPPLPERRSEDWGVAVEEGGRYLLTLALHAEPAPIRERLAQRFPRDWTWDWPATPNPFAADQAEAVLADLIERELNPGVTA